MSEEFTDKAVESLNKVLDKPLDWATQNLERKTNETLLKVWRFFKEKKKEKKDG